MRKMPLITGEVYHIFNRGVDKRLIFLDEQDMRRFLQSMELFNTKKPIGSIFEFVHTKQQRKDDEPLIKYIAYNLLPNHFHLIVQQVSNEGISEFMKRLSGGYTWYFNNRYKRSGSLFQGTYKAIHVDTNEYLLYVSAYVNTNHLQKSFGGLAAKSSWEEYIGQCRSNKVRCHNKSIVTDQFSSVESYKTFALAVLQEIQENKRRYYLKNSFWRLNRQKTRSRQGRQLF